MRGRSFTHEAALGVNYIFDSDEERERTGSRLSGSTVVPSQRIAERDSTYVPGDEEEFDDDMYDGPSPSTYRKRPRAELGAGEEGQTARKVARLGGKKAHHAGPTTSAAASSSIAHPAREPIATSEPQHTREFIYVSSDSEVQPNSVSSSKRKKKTKQPRHQGALESVVLQARKTSKGKEPAKKNGPPQQGEPPLAIPSWFDDAISDIRGSFPTVQLAVFCSTSDDQSRWGVRCLLCDPPREIMVGPGFSLRNFRSHLTGFKSHYMQPEPTANEQPVSSTSKPKQHTPAGALCQSSKEGVRVPRVPPPKIPKTPKKRKPEVEDVVERFLKGMGLKAELADALRRVGISDEARMKALGHLPDPVLDRLEKCLAEEGLDVTALLLVREGLKRRATAP
ncbi:hypothetical protein C8T65DRAFT_231512 [Cerioporus squamosus]|nr:hypothetical protein C8T65DRAFT_231512 [Cerioporus squamosus]